MFNIKPLLCIDMCSFYVLPLTVQLCRVLMIEPATYVQTISSSMVVLFMYIHFSA